MKNSKLKIVIGQINPIVGDLDYNTKKIINIIKNNQNANIIVFPEMSLVGYPLMDHIHDPLIRRRNRESIEKIKSLNSRATTILGTFTESKKIREKVHPFYNSAVIIENRDIKAIVNKRILPDYDVFNERRYFTFENEFDPIKIKGLRIGILICEDIWDENYEIKVANHLVKNGADMLIVINASPYHIGKFEIRKELICKKAKKLSVPIAYVNMVGAIDEIVYDGQSFIVNKFGQIIHKAKAFNEDIVVVELLIDDVKIKKEKSYGMDWREEVLEALKLNLYDYYHKSNIFDGVVLGVSGGIDSAFTAYICAEALGSDKVNVIMMPTRFTSQESLDLAEKLVKNLNINYRVHPIDELFDSYEKDIEKNLGKVKFDIADENLQARIRATILMYYSNKYNWLLVSTGNKSEIGVGYCTLYGDTNGGKNVPGDLLKTQIYSICEWINKEKEIIPKGIIERPPTAELRENQKDEDSLPPYGTLDIILEEIIKHGIGAELDHLKDKGIDQKTINHVRKLYLNSEYKRRQLVQTIKVSESAFGIGRRYPVLKKINF
ncbi:MAG: NAD+ synthase [Candidatus Odinarchaeota archaeon]